MAEDKAALLEHYRQMREGILAALDGLSDALMTEVSLDGWSIKDHLAHIATWDEIRVSEVLRISAGNESAWKASVEQDDVFNNLAYELRRDLPLAQVRWEFATTRQQLLEAIAAATDRGLDGSLYGEAGLRSSHEAQHAGWIKTWREGKGV